MGGCFDVDGNRHYWAWSPTGEVNFHIPQQFGALSPYLLYTPLLLDPCGPSGPYFTRFHEFELHYRQIRFSGSDRKPFDLKNSQLTASVSVRMRPKHVKIITMNQKKAQLFLWEELEPFFDMRLLRARDAADRAKGLNEGSEVSSR